MTTAPLTEQQLDEITARAAHLHEYATLTDGPLQADADQLTGEDVPALLAELRRRGAALTEMTHCRDNALRALYRDDVETDIDLEETAAMHGWDADTVAKVRRYRAAVRALTDTAAAPATGQPPADTGEEARGDFEAGLPSETGPKGSSKATPIHVRPGPDDNGVSPCCGRPPFEFRGERLTRDPAAVTCTAPPAVVAEPGKENSRG